jgi:hypothetical protein
LNKCLWLALVLVVLIAVVLFCSGCILIDMLKKAEDISNQVKEPVENIPDGLLPPGGPQIKWGLVTFLTLFGTGCAALRKGLERLQGKEANMATAKKGAGNVVTRLLSSRKYVVAFVAVILLVVAEKYSGLDLGADGLVKSVLVLILAPMAGNAIEDAAEKLKS